MRQLLLLFYVISGLFAFAQSFADGDKLVEDFSH